MTDRTDKPESPDTRSWERPSPTPTHPIPTALSWAWCASFVSHDRYPGRLSFPLRFPNRRFRIWSYVPSHSGLVLRTEFEPDAPHIERTNDADPDDVTFLLGNDHFSGHVLAGHLFLDQEERSRYSDFERGLRTPSA
ncbi:hypothetical protein ACWEPN_29670 [Nonomuraea wenchangensis]